MADKSCTKRRVFIEIACFTAESVLLADSAGADRIEFCADRAAGGVTPSLSELYDVAAKCSKPINVMIRPRGGNFVYTTEEYAQMSNDIRNILSGGCVANGFVFGVLDTNNQVDLKRNKELVALAHPRPCTFHRAFDETSDMVKALEDVISCGFKTILTSGGAENAVAGAGVLQNLVRKAGGRIEILPGGGVRGSNLSWLFSKTGADWYHSSAILGAGEDADEKQIRSLRESV